MHVYPLSDRSHVRAIRMSEKITLVFSYKTDDETKTPQIYKTAAGKPCGFIIKTVDILEQIFGHDVYIEMRDMQAGSEAFEQQVRSIK